VVLQSQTKGTDSAVIEPLISNQQEKPMPNLPNFKPRKTLQFYKREIGASKEFGVVAIKPRELGGFTYYPSTDCVKGWKGFYWSLKEMESFYLKRRREVFIPITKKYALEIVPDVLKRLKSYPIKKKN